MSAIKGAVAGSAGCAIDANRAPTKEQYRRAAMISDIAGAMSNGFKAEPDLSPCHLPLLSTEALERVHKESETWGDLNAHRKLNIRINELENIIGSARSAYLHGTPATAATQMFVILGEFKSDEYAWLNWGFDFMPQGLAEDTTVEIQTNGGVYFTLSAGSVKWSGVAKYRRVK